MTAASLNFALLDANRPEVARLIAAMVQARDAVEHRSWSYPQESSGEEWWADVLADPRARKRERRTDLAVKRTFYRLADEKRDIIFVACSKCEAAGRVCAGRTDRRPRYRQTRCQTYSTISPRRVVVGSALIGIAAACTTSSRSRAHARACTAHISASSRYTEYRARRV